MKRLIRISALVIGLGLLLALGLFAYLRFAFDPNDYRERIGRAVLEHTGRELRIDGDLRLSVFPWLGVAVGAARLGNPPGFSAAEFASLRSAQLRVRLLPLLSGRIEVGRVVLDGLTLALERNAEGAENWSGLAGEPRGEAGSGEGGVAPVVALAGIELRDARLLWLDARCGQRIGLDGLSLSSGRFEAAGATPLEISASFSAAQPAVQGQLKLRATLRADGPRQRFAIDRLRLELDVGLDGLAAPVRATLEADLEADAAARTAELTRLRLALLGVELDARGHIDEVDGVARVEGEFSVARFSPRELARRLGRPLAPLADGQALGRMALGGRFSAAGAAISLSQLALQFDDSTLHGELTITPAVEPLIEFALALDALDADRYRPAAGPADAPTEPDEGAAIGPAIPAGVALHGELTIERLKLAGLSLAEIRVPLSVRDGRAMLAPQAVLYGGRYRGNIGIDGQGRALGVSLDESLAGVSIGPLLRDLTGQPERLVGTAELGAKLTASGRDAQSLKRNLNGSVALKFTDGALKGVNVAAFMREAEARLTGQPVPAGDEPNQTDFTDLLATLRVTDGVARNDDLALRSPLLRVRGEGEADLMAEQIDYRVRASLVGTLTGQGGKPLEKVGRVTVPLRVSGSFAQPEVRLDVESLLSQKLRHKIEDKKEQIRSQATDKLREELQKGFGGLFR